MRSNYNIFNLIPANEALLVQDVYLVLLYATRVPPHLLVSVKGKIFTLSTKGATVDGELAALITLIRKRNIETVFIRLALPPLFTMEQLKDIMRKCTLAYPRVDAGLATCLAPIRDFCNSVYKVEKQNINLIFDLLPKLQEHNAMQECYHINLERHLTDNALSMRRYSVNDIYEAIREPGLVNG